MLEHRLHLLDGIANPFYGGITVGILLLTCAGGGAQQISQAIDSGPAPSLVLRGTITGVQNNTYLEVPFDVPAGTYRVTLSFDYTGRDQRTTLDLGMLDPQGLRCWSGGNKSTLTVSATDATPSCLAGPVAPGTWKLLIGVPNIRASATSAYTANLYFTRSGLVADEPSILRAPIRSGPAWYRGDLHMHTAHSDGSCNSLRGVKVPCPVFVVMDAAARCGLDYIAITDHNITSQNESMRELAPYFDNLLLIPGREITTFHGHANLFGTVEFLDFRLGSHDVPDINTLLRHADALGGLVSINHPNAPTGEVCMGCGWTPSPPTDLGLVQAIEAVNSGSEQGPYSGVSFWERQLNQGFRLTGVGGSDNHTAQRSLDQIGAVGSPTTVVFATELSVPAILDGIRAGHVFVDLTASKDRVLELHAQTGGLTANMGDRLTAASQAEVEFAVHTKGVEGATRIFLEDGKPFSDSGDAKVKNSDETIRLRWISDGKRHWFRSDVRGPDGKLWLMGNPVYVNWPSTDDKAAKQ